MDNLYAKLNSMLVKAWKEHWTDIQWGKNIKLFLSKRTDVVDTYSVANCILEESLIGPVPNKLIFSYLKHSLNSKLISYDAVLNGIITFDDFSETYCIQFLINILDEILPHAYYACKPEDCAALFSALRSCIFWLLSCLHYLIFTLNEKETSDTLFEIKKIVFLKIINILKFIQSDKFLCASLIGSENKTFLEEIVAKCNLIMQADNAFSIFSDREQNEVKVSFRKFQDFQNLILYIKPLSQKISCTFMQNFFSIKVLMSSNFDELVEELSVIKSLIGYADREFITIILHSCFVGLHQSQNVVHEEIKWSVFLFMIVPKVLHEFFINGIFVNPNDICEAFENILVYYSPLLDKMDVIFSCNFLEIFLNELMKLNLIESTDIQGLLQKRAPSSSKFFIRWNNSSSTDVKLLIRVDVTINTILKTLKYSDSQKNLFNNESLLSVLCSLMSERTLQIILASLHATNQLKTFFNKLLSISETCKQAIGESPKIILQKSLLFDLCFILMFYIMQQYGFSIISTSKKNDFLFGIWLNKFFTELGILLPSEAILNSCDSSILDYVLQLLQSSDDVRLSYPNFSELCLNIPAAVKEILFAWDNESLSGFEVQKIFNNIIKMGCFCISTAAWLISFENTIPKLTLLALQRNMIQQLLSFHNIETSQENCNERFNLVVSIITKMNYKNISHLNINALKLLTQKLNTSFQNVLTNGRLTQSELDHFHYLLNLGGPFWMLNNLIQNATQVINRLSFENILAVICNICHIDIYVFAVTLMKEILPQFIFKISFNNNILDKIQDVENFKYVCYPYLTLLAPLTVYCIFMATLKQLRQNKSSQIKTEDIYDDSKVISKYKHSSPANYTCRTDIFQVISSLFSHFLIISSKGELSPETEFIFMILKEIVESDNEISNVILQYIPPELPLNLAAMMPDKFTIRLATQLLDKLPSHKKCWKDATINLLYRLQKESAV